MHQKFLSTRGLGNTKLSLSNPELSPRYNSPWPKIEEGGGYTLKGSNKHPHILGNMATESCNATLTNCMYNMETTPNTFRSERSKDYDNDTRIQQLGRSNSIISNTTNKLALLFSAAICLLGFWIRICS